MVSLSTARSLAGLRHLLCLNGATACGSLRGQGCTGIFQDGVNICLDLGVQVQASGV